MEFAKTIAIAPTAPTAPPSYDTSHQSQNFQNDSFQKQMPPQSGYPHSMPQPTITTPHNNAYPQQNQSGYYPAYQRPGQIVITQAPITIVKPPGRV